MNGELDRFHLTDTHGAGINENGSMRTNYDEVKVSRKVLEAQREIQQAVFTLIENTSLSLDLQKKLINERIIPNMKILKEGGIDISGIEVLLKPQSYEAKLKNMPHIKNIIEKILKKG